MWRRITDEYEGTPLGQSLGSLPQERRAQRYREFADEAFRRACATADDEVRTNYLSMATRWHTLATEMERAARQPQ
jgi:hypothetical protein